MALPTSLDVALPKGDEAAHYISALLFCGRFSRLHSVVQQHDIGRPVRVNSPRQETMIVLSHLSNRFSPLVQNFIGRLTARFQPLDAEVVSDILRHGGKGHPSRILNVLVPQSFQSAFKCDPVSIGILFRVRPVSALEAEILGFDNDLAAISGGGGEWIFHQWSSVRVWAQHRSQRSGKDKVQLPQWLMNELDPLMAILRPRVDPFGQGHVLS